ncbi:MAG: Crp/Fnr family transcriptional regulator [Dehalococcoidia bacterium]|nr:MAG: Crp/Fnr family transcriptional regulator [Dehalococcoidia bacterium]
MPNIEEEPYCLKGVDLFRGLTTEEIASAERMTHVITRKKGEILYSPDEKKEVLFFLKEGKIQLYRLSAEGKKLVVATLGPNTFFGEMALVGQKMYDTFAEVLEDATLCIMTRKDVAHLLLAKPAIALNLVETLGRRLLEMESTLDDLAFKNVPARLASTLLSMAEERNSNEILGVSHQDLAERLATVRETVTSTLDKFKTEGLVELGWRKIVILNKERLSHIAKG